MMPNEQMIARLSDIVDEAQARLDLIQSESMFLIRSIAVTKSTIVHLRSLDNPTQSRG